MKTEERSADRLPPPPALIGESLSTKSSVWYNLAAAARKSQQELGRKDTARLLRYLAKCLEDDTP